ncbi:hypothetical protein [Brevundimonas sp.]|uniref:hypothetical protein n=1 Tax=Brevundimonas sp. TaxID=1871086 RepID=UPI002FC7B8EE
MSLRLILSAAAVIGLALPAQAVLATPAAAQTAAPQSEELDMEEASARFKERMDALKAELETVVAANAGKPEALSTSIDETIARYKGDFDAFANMMDTYFATMIDSAETDAKKQEYQGVREQVVPMLRTLPAQIRTATLEYANTPK